MRPWRKFAFGVVLSALLVVGLTAQAVESTTTLGEGRYFVSTENAVVKKLFGARHEFSGGFTTDLTRGELWALDRIFKIPVEAVPLWSVSPVRSSTILEEGKNLKGEAGFASEQSFDATSRRASNGVSPESPIAVSIESLFGLPSAKKEPPGQKPLSRKFFPDDATGWGIETVYNSPLISATSGGEGTVVAILDTGAEVKHLDIVRRVSECVDFTRSSIITNTCEDKNGHGTHVAGVISADGGEDGRGLWGVAPAAGLAVYKVCRNDGTCWADDVAAAIGYAVGKGADIVSMSFGGSKESTLVRDAVRGAYEKNVLLVASAGNAGPKRGTLTYPAAHAEVVAVGAIDFKLAVADWSSRGLNDGDYIVENGEIELVAPGVDIESTWSDGSYRYLTGTSMAAPFVSGLAAKLWDGVATSTRALLQRLAIDIAPVGDDISSGFGLPVLPK